MTNEKFGATPETRKTELLDQAVKELRKSPRFPEYSRAVDEEDEEGIISVTKLDGVEVNGIPLTVEFRKHAQGSNTNLISASRPLDPTPEIDSRWVIIFNPFHQQILTAEGIKEGKIVQLSNFLVQNVSQKLHKLTTGSEY